MRWIPNLPKPGASSWPILINDSIRRAVGTAHIPTALFLRPNPGGRNKPKATAAARRSSMLGAVDPLDLSTDCASDHTESAPVLTRYAAARFGEAVGPEMMDLMGT